MMFCFFKGEGRKGRGEGECQGSAPPPAGASASLVYILAASKTDPRRFLRFVYGKNVGLRIREKRWPMRKSHSEKAFGLEGEGEGGDDRLERGEGCLTSLAESESVTAK